MRLKQLGKPQRQSLSVIELSTVIVKESSSANLGWPWSAQQLKPTITLLMAIVTQWLSCSCTTLALLA
jgi:hypothetical protein